MQTLSPSVAVSPAWWPSPVAPRRLSAPSRLPTVFDNLPNNLHRTSRQHSVTWSVTSLWVIAVTKTTRSGGRLYHGRTASSVTRTLRSLILYVRDSLALLQGALRCWLNGDTATGALFYCVQSARWSGENNYRPQVIRLPGQLYREVADIPFSWTRVIRQLLLLVLYW